MTSPIGRLWSWVREAIPPRGGLRRRILLWFLALSLLPLFVSNVVGYVVTRSIMENQVQRYLVEFTKTGAQHVAREMDRRQLGFEAGVRQDTVLGLHAARALRAVQSGSRAGKEVDVLSGYLREKLLQLPALTEIFMVDMAGTVIAASSGRHIDAKWGGTEILRTRLAKTLIAQNLVRVSGLLEPIPLVATTIAVVAGDGPVVVVGSVALEGLTGFLRISPHVADDVHSYIVDPEGRPVVISHVHVPIDRSKVFPSPALDMLGGTVSKYVNYEGVEVLGASVDIPGIPWRYVTEVSVVSAFGQLTRLGALASASQAVFAALLVVVVWLVARTMVAPLHRLVAGTELIRRGEFGVEVQIDRHDELGELGDTFNQMSRELETSSREIQELHDREMQRAAQLASVGELASGIAHEIKNPMVGVRAGLDLLSTRIDGGSDAREIMSQMRTQLERMEITIRDLLSYARPKELHLMWTAPSQLVSRVVALVGPQAGASGVKLEKDVSADVADIHIDPELMTQALVNLSLNGIQSMKQGGTLRVSTVNKGEEVRISVTDSGSGISKDHLESIFRPFYTTKHKGTGLGLAITRGIVERHGGRLEVQSEVGKGSTFTLVLTVKRSNGS